MPSPPDPVDRHPPRAPGDAPGDKQTYMQRVARSYRPRRMWDFIFLHGFAVLAARRIARDGERLYVPREWEEEA